ncbi:MAG TPA: hypothetical protein PKD55_06565 [Bellilinea sp.]|nr:hypothetical protein [Bellilinea sp.]
MNQFRDYFGSINNGNWLSGLKNQAVLVYRLIKDPRVPKLLKALPIGSLAYLIIPDIFPLPIDDAIVIILATNTFVQLCPADVVAEHRYYMENPTAYRDFVNNRTAAQRRAEEEIVIDGNFKDVE